MSSNTFENDPSVRGVKSFLEITKTPAGIRITIQESPDVTHGWFAPDQAPAIALAILEAAGYDDKADDMSQADAHAFDAMHKLQQSVDEQERATAEAREQAELEAEALELFQASRLNGETLPSFEGYPDIKLQWLAVARRAREMRNEKKEQTDD